MPSSSKCSIGRRTHIGNNLGHLSQSHHSQQALVINSIHFAKYSLHNVPKKGLIVKFR